MVFGAFLPWGGSGSADRTSFELVGVAETFDVLTGPAATAATAWYLLPALGAAVVLATAFRRPTTAAVLGGVAAVSGAAFALAVRSSLLVPKVGTSVTIAGAVITGAGVALGIAARRTTTRST